MKVRIRLFAQQRQLTGWRERTIEVPDGGPISAAWDALVREWPVLAAGTDSVRFARNAVYADADEPLSEGDEVAVIPPVAGGSAAPGERATLVGSAPADVTASVIPSATVIGSAAAGMAKLSKAHRQHLIHHVSGVAAMPSRRHRALPTPTGAKVAANDYLRGPTSAELIPPRVSRAGSMDKVLQVNIRHNLGAEPETRS